MIEKLWVMLRIMMRAQHFSRGKLEENSLKKGTANLWSIWGTVKF